MIKTRTAKYAYVKEFNNIAIITDSGKEGCWQWYRTDSDGVREAQELVFLRTKRDVKRCLKQMNANIYPSTKQLIGL